MAVSKVLIPTHGSTEEQRFEQATILATLISALHRQALEADVVYMTDRSERGNIEVTVREAR